MENEQIKGRVSYSQFTMWTGCPFQWKLRYVDRIKVPSVSIHLLFGTALNDTIQLFLTTYYEKTEKEANELDLNQFMLKRMLEVFETYEKQDGNGFTTEKEMNQFYKDGVKIIDWFKKKRSDYFMKKNYELLGCELQLEFPIKENVSFIGRIDCAIKHTPTDLIKIYDFKKSMRGWSDDMKKDPYKRGQLQIYKKFYSQQFNVDLDKISIEFLIFKQRISENSEFPSKRVQKYQPPDSERSINKILKEFEQFVGAVFNEDGSHKTDIEYEKKPSKYSCQYCPFKDKKDICPVGISK
ncbi:MAG: hypothetical protein JETCAE03_32740 [Ignavibacteriaceae bacterium]|nr:MAG: hypothetical protein JETCAE03_32740 [Ignavibacteriaceae bacterium]